MVPLLAVKYRTALLLLSAMNRLPLASALIPCGWFNCALVAGPPSPLKPEFPLPATVLMLPPTLKRRITLALESERYRLPVVVSKDSPLMLLKVAERAGPPSPPEVPLPWPPATVLMVPLGVTMRTLLLPSAK